MHDIHQTLHYANYLRSVGWVVERKEGINYFIKKLPLIGSVLKIQRPNKIDYQSIDSLVVKYKVFQTTIEPALSPSTGSAHVNLLYTHGFKPSKSPFLPTRTLHLNLNTSLIRINRLFKKDARGAIRKNKELRIKHYDQKDIEQFRQLWKGSVGLKRYIPPINHLTALKKSFGKNALFITNKKAGLPRQSSEGVSAGLPAEALAKAGAIFLRTKDTAHYWQAFTNKQGRQQKMQYKIVWEGIKWAKKAGCKIFDFEGIYDERFPNKSWLGFTHFKKSFGGREIEYPGCFVKTKLFM